MLVSEKLYIVSRRSVLEHRINERLIYFSCWINGNVSAEYLPPFTPSPPSCAWQIQRRLTMHGEHACIDNWTSRWNRIIPFAPSEIRMDRAPGGRSVTVQTSAVSMQSFCGTLREVVILLVGFQQGKKGPSTALLCVSLARRCWSMPYYGQQPAVRWLSQKLMALQSSIAGSLSWKCGFTWGFSSGLKFSISRLLFHPLLPTTIYYASTCTRIGINKTRINETFRLRGGETTFF